MKFTADDMINKIPERGDPAAYFRYNPIRRTMEIRYGRVQETLPDFFRIGEQIVHKDNLICVLDMSIYTKIIANEIRESRKKLENFKTT